MNSDTLSSCKNLYAESRQGGPALEALEARLLLSGVAPVFATLPTDQWFASDGALTFGIDGYDAEGDALTITVEPDTSGVSVLVPTGNRYGRLHFVESDGVTPIGDIVVQIFEARAGEAAERFITLATNHVNPDGSLDPGGVPFYTDVVVHRVIPRFMIQMGDAENGDGSGDSPLGSFDDAFDPDLSFTNAGVLAMANSGANTNDCQFFITDGRSDWLNQKHMIFGHVISGYDVLDTIINLPTEPGSDRPANAPLLDYVEIYQSDQDATVTFQTVDGWAGETQVTIRLDDGTSVTSETITVTALGERPEIVDPGTILATPGETTSFFIEVNDDSGLPFDLRANITIVEATVQADAATGQVDVSVSADFSGLIQVTLEAVETGYDLESSMASIYVLAQKAGDPPFLGRASAGTDGTALHTHVVGDRLYMASMSAGLEVYNIADLANPVLLGAHEMPDPAVPGEPTAARSVTVVGNTAFISATFAGLVSVDVTDPEAMVTLDVESVDSVAVTHVIDGDIAYVASWMTGLTAVDISDPNDLRVVGTFKDFGGSYGLRDALGVALKGHYAFVSDGAGGFVVVNVSNPENMKYVTAVWTGTKPWGIEVCGDYLYIADQGGGLMVYNIARPQRPKYVGQLPLTNAWQVAVAGQMAIVAAAEGFAFVDVSDPENMSVEYDFKAPSLGGIPSIVGTQIALPTHAAGTVLLEGADLINRVKIYKKLTLTDDAGVLVTISVKGATATAHTTGTGTGDIETLEITPDSAKASVKITTKGGETTIGDIVIHGSVKSFDCKGVNLGGDLTVEGTISKLRLGDVDSQHTITIGPRPDGDTRTAVAMTFRHVAETSIVSETPIKSIIVADWLDEDGTPDEIQAPWVGKLTTKGDRGTGAAGHFQADLVLDGTGSPRFTLGSTRIAGDVVGALWDITGGVGKLTVGGKFQDSRIQSTGPISSITLGEWLDTDATEDAIQAAWIGKLAARGNKKTGSAGDFQANLELDGTGAKKATLGSARISGDLSEVLWEITGNMGRLTVNGTALDSTIRTTGDMAGVTLGAAHGSDFLAGILEAAARRAGGYSDFESPRMIKSVKIKGLKAPGRFFTDSNFSAASFGSVSLLNAQVDNGGTDFGVFARADGSGKEVKSVKYADTESGEKWRWSSRDSVFLTKRDLMLICHTDHPMVTYSMTELGGELYGLSFMVRGNDGQTASFFADMTFEGVDGGWIVQQNVFLGGDGIEVDEVTYANIFDGLGTPPYDKTRDSYFLDPFGSGDVQELNKSDNFYHIKAGTGQSSLLQDAELAYIVTPGSVHYYGSIARQGTSYPVDGIAII